MIVNVVQFCPNIEQLTTLENGSVTKKTLTLNSGLTLTKVRYVAPVNSGPNYVNIHFEDNTVLLSVLSSSIEYSERDNQEIINNMIPPSEKESVLSKARVPGEPKKRRGCCGRKR
jgi:hypothetical protein